MKMKKCSKCNEEKELTIENFSWRTDSKTFRGTCKVCRTEFSKQYYETNKESINESHKQYRENNQESIKKFQKQYKENNQESIKKYNKQYYETNKETINENGKIYYEANKESINESHKQYYEVNKDSLKETRKRYRENNQDAIKQYREDNKDAINKHQRERKENDPAYKLRCYVSGNINQMLKKNGGSKNGESSFNYLPYTSEELRLHIENGFEDWMNWGNQGMYDPKTWDDNDPSTMKWQLDHIIPKSDLPHKTMEEENFQKCWALSNLRPLSAKQNLLDGVNRTRHKKKDL